MATQMPIPPDYNRFIPGQPGQPPQQPTPHDIEEEQSGALFENIAELGDVEETEDGGAIVRMEDKYLGPEDTPDFYENLAESMPDWEMSKLSLKYLDLIEKDKDAREERDKQYEEGIRRTGLGNDAPGGAQFQGASKVVHPIMAEACVDFASRAIKELFPPDGPVRTKIVGEVTEEKSSRADRKKEFMNWQLTEQIEEYKDEQEVLFTQLPLGGSQYFKVWYDEQKRRPCVEFLPIDNVYLPFAAVNFYTAGRVTEAQDITEEEFEQRKDIGMYRDVETYRASQEPDQTKPQKANDKIEGKSMQDVNIDGLRRVYHIYLWLEVESDKHSKGERAPYIMMIDSMSGDFLGLYRNWENGDETLTKLDWIVEFKFIPWRGAYAIGLPHLIGGLSAALTGALRALLDSAHINNAPTMLKLKGGKISGQSTTIEPTQVVEIEGAPGVDDIRKIAMPVPFNPPSPILFQLLGWLTDAAKGVVTTSEEKIADINSQAPVGTTQALIEQGAAVFSSIHSRLHDSQKRVLKILGRLNRWYLDEQRLDDILDDIGITADDFKKNNDIVPVSDPHIFSETQRYAQVQALAARAAASPDLYNRIAVERRILKQIKLPDINEVLPNPSDMQDMNPALENVAMSIGKHAGAFPQQDHLAHIQVHLDFLQDPMLGANPLIAPAFIPAMLEHVKQHITMWYLSQMNNYASAALGRPFNIYEEKPIPNEAQQLLAINAQHVHQDTEQTFAKVAPILVKAMQVMQQLQGQPPVDPQIQALVQTSMAETQRKAAKDDQDGKMGMAKLMQQQQATSEKLKVDLLRNTENNLTEERIKSAELTKDAAQLQHEQLQTALNVQQSLQSQIGEQNV